MAVSKTTTPRKKIVTRKKEEVSHKLRIRIRAYEHKILDASVKQVMDTALRYDALVRGPTPLPV